MALSIRLPLLEESVRFKKAGMKGDFKGNLELYEDAVMLRFPPNLLSVISIKPIPPTFPIVGEAKTISFSQIKAITGTSIRRLLWKKMKIELQTMVGDHWTIVASTRAYEALTNAYSPWRK